MALKAVDLGYGFVTFHPADVIDLAENELNIDLTDKQARNLLRDKEDIIRCDMITAGRACICNLIQGIEDEEQRHKEDADESEEDNEF